MTTGIEYDINKRWEAGTPHHPESVRLFERLAQIDWHGKDYFHWKTGGDGDNGEILMYQLDILFEERDAVQKGDLSDAEKVLCWKDACERILKLFPTTTKVEVEPHALLAFMIGVKMRLEKAEGEAR
jgi:hypothetical protein